MKFKVLIIILQFLTLAVAVAGVFFFLMSTCYECLKTFLYAQFLDVTYFGFLLLIFFVCVSIMAKEQIPPKMQLMFSFSSATMYFLAMALLVYLYVELRPKENGTTVPHLCFLTILGALHLSVGLLHIFRDRITTLT